MMLCRTGCGCYQRYTTILGEAIGRCLGTKEIELCNCGGDESKCDFYPDKRKKSKKPSLSDIIQELMKNDFELNIRIAFAFNNTIRVSIKDRNNGRVIEQCLRRENSLSFSYEEAFLEMIYSMIYDLKEQENSGLVVMRNKAGNHKIVFKK